MTTVRRISRLTPAQSRLVSAAQTAMLAVERSTLSALEAASDTATRRLLDAAVLSLSPMAARRAILIAGRRVADQLRVDAAAAVRRGRSQARALAYQRFASELAIAARELAIQPIPTPRAPDSFLEDDAHAQGAADAYVAAWRAAVTLVAVRQDDDRTVPKALREAVQGQAYRLQRIAATEVPQAYNTAHDEGCAEVAREHAEARWFPLVGKRWDARLDRACPICRNMDGRYTLLGMRFKGGLIPGSVHNHCRCVESIVALPIRARGEADAVEEAA